MIHQIIWLNSTANPFARRFAYVERFAEGEQEADWTWPLTSVERPEILCGQILPCELEQFDWMKPEQPGLLQFQDRINRTLNRDDLRVTWMFISEPDWQLAPDANCLSDFPSPPRQAYMDIYAAGRAAHVVARESLDEFIRAGGLWSIQDDDG